MSKDDSRQKMAENRRVFEGLMVEASSALRSYRVRSAAASLQTAARFAWYNHPGVFQSPELEKMAVDIGNELPSLRHRRRATRSDVLHVLTQAYSIGGHTRLVWRWIENDPSRVHSVVITGQEGLRIPRELRDAVTRSGGRITSLGTTSDLRTRAQRLRRVVSESGGVVVLHVHPHDVTPLIALAPLVAQVVFLNHADHVFWVGRLVTNVLADIRPVGRVLSLARRSVSNEASTVLPIPLRDTPSMARDQARALLNLPESSVVILSIASSYKYAAPAGDHFVDVHRAFILAHGNTRLIVVGPQPVDRWATVAEETNGRFQAVGVKDDLSVYYAAADIYVDSFPVSSLTSLIDAGLAGIAAISLNESVAHSVLTADDISFTRDMQFSSRSRYLDELGALASQPARREASGVIIQKAVQRDHLSPGWNRHLVRLFDQLRAVGTRRNLTNGVAVHHGDNDLDEVELALVEAHVASGVAMSLWEARLRDAPFRSLPERARIVTAAPKGKRAKSLVYLLPEAALTPVKVCWRMFARVRHAIRRNT